MNVNALRRSAFTLAGVLLLLYVLNVALRIARIKLGAHVWALNDVGEFLLVLLCMVAFVAGLLAIEAGAPDANSMDDNIRTGGVR